jgi:hypothetical protein
MPTNVTRAAMYFVLIPLALAPAGAFADRDTLAGLATPPIALPEAPGDAEDSVYEVPAPPVTIEGELPHLEPTPEDLIRHFRDSLTAPPSFLSSERRLADGTIEARTRFGRFCAPPLPAQSISGVGGDVRLIAPCASF